MTLINPAEHFASNFFLLQKYHFINTNGLCRIAFVVTQFCLEKYTGQIILFKTFSFSLVRMEHLIS